MNGFLWLGVACTVVLVIAIVLDGLDDAFDALDLGPSWLSLPVLAAFGGAFGFVAGALIGGLGLAVLVLALIAFVITRVKVAGPNEAFIITGRKG